MDTLFIGTLERASSLRLGDTLLQLTPLVPTTTADLTTNPVPGVLEREGQVAVVKGERVGDTVFRARLVEALPPIASEVTRALLREGVLTVQDLQDRTQAALRALTGDAAPAEADAPRKTCALVVGHRPGARGASNAGRGLFEFDFNQALAATIQAQVQHAEVVIALRDDDSQGYNRLPSQLNALRPHFIVSLHCNAATPTAHGTEMLYYHKSTNGHRMARILQQHVLNALGLRNRNTKSRTEHDRGGHLLKNTHAPCVIAEPFFLSNEDDVSTALARLDALAGAYAAAIDEIAQTL